MGPRECSASTNYITYPSFSGNGMCFLGQTVDWPNFSVEGRGDSRLELYSQNEVKGLQMLSYCKEAYRVLGKKADHGRVQSRNYLNNESTWVRTGHE